MTWSEHHKESEELASSAHELLRLGDAEKAQENFLKAAEAEYLALRSLKPSDKPRTFSITAVSVTALWFKAGKISRAQSFAREVLEIPYLLPFAVDQLNEFLRSADTVTSHGVRPSWRILELPSLLASHPGRSAFAAILGLAIWATIALVSGEVATKTSLVSLLAVMVLSGLTVHTIAYFWARLSRRVVRMMSPGVNQEDDTERTAAERRFRSHDDVTNAIRRQIIIHRKSKLQDEDRPE